MIDHQSVDHDWALHIVSSAAQVIQIPTIQYLQPTLVVSRSSDDEPSTSVEEQGVTAAMGCLNRIAPDNCETLLSLDSFSGLMALKKVCMYSDLTARHGILTEEACLLLLASFHIQQMCAKGVDFGIMHNAACHNREKKWNNRLWSNCHGTSKPCV